MTSWLGKDRAPIEGCVFAFECPKTWGALEKTNIDSVRHCSSCDRNVYLSVTVDAFNSNVLKGRCVAVPVNNPKRAYPADTAQLDSFIIGEPAMPFNYGDLDHEVE